MLLFKHYLVIYFKILNIYQRTRQPKRKPKTEKIVDLTNKHYFMVPNVSVDLVADLKEIEPDLN